MQNLNTLASCADLERDHKAIRFLNNTGPDSLKNH